MTDHEGVEKFSPIQKDIVGEIMDQMYPCTAPRSCDNININISSLFLIFFVFPHFLGKIWVSP